MNKVSFYVEDGILPYLLKCNVSHTIVGKIEGFLRIEIEPSGLTLINLVGAAYAYGEATAINSLVNSIAA